MTKKTTEKRNKKRKGGFCGIFLGALGARMLGDMLTGKEVIRAGKGVVRAEKGVVRARKVYHETDHEDKNC